MKDLAGGIGDLLMGSPGKTIPMKIEGGKIDWKLVGYKQGLLDKVGDQLQSTFSEQAMFGSSGRRVQVPVEGGRFEWKIVGAKEGWLDALERELEGGINEIDFGRVGQVLATTGSGLIQVAGVLAVSLAKLIGAAIRGINWGEVGQEIAKGMSRTVPEAAEAVADEYKRTLEDKLGAAGGVIWEWSPITQGPARKFWGAVFDEIQDDASAASGGVQALTGRVNVLGSALDRLPENVKTVLENNALMAKSQVEEYHAALNRVAAIPDIFNRITTIETRRSQVLSGTGGPKAFGGPVNPNFSYLVGERGPEVFVPHRAGDVVPNRQLGPNTAPMRLVINAEPGTEAMLRKMIRSVAVEADNELGRRADRKRRTFSGR